MTPSKVVVRFLISSKVLSKDDFLKVIARLPPGYGDSVSIKGERKKLKNGAYVGVSSKISCVTYKYTFKEVFDLENCLTAFLSEWREKTLLEELSSNAGIDFQLDIEVILINNDFPSFIFSSDIISFMEKIKGAMSLEFYHE